MSLNIGAQAPDFCLKSLSTGDMADVKLSDHRGKENVILLFYPGAFTHICQQEMCDFTEGMNTYTDLHAVVYGISPDSPYALQAWAEKFEIKVPLLSDYHREVTKAYDVVWPNFSGLGEGTARAAFVIDREGVIQYAEQTPTLLDLPNYAAIQECLQGLESLVEA